jgi:hypothetical protein
VKIAHELEKISQNQTKEEFASQIKMFTSVGIALATMRCSIRKPIKRI